MEQDQHLRDNQRTDVLAALQNAESKGPPSLETLFEDVYDVKIPHLLVRALLWLLRLSLVGYWPLSNHFNVCVHNSAKRRRCSSTWPSTQTTTRLATKRLKHCQQLRILSLEDQYYRELSYFIPPANRKLTVSLSLQSNNHFPTITIILNQLVRCLFHRSCYHVPLMRFYRVRAVVSTSKSECSSLSLLSRTITLSIRRFESSSSCFQFSRSSSVVPETVFLRIASWERCSELKRSVSGICSM